MIDIEEVQSANNHGLYALHYSGMLGVCALHGGNVVGNVVGALMYF